MTRTPRTFDDLVAEAAAVDVSGWDFSWLDGRATRQRPSWGYARLLADRLRDARAALDLVTSRHPATIWWVPDFTVDRYRDRLLALHDLIERDGAFVAHSSRTLIEARKPTA